MDKKDKNKITRDIYKKNLIKLMEFIKNNTKNEITTTLDPKTPR